MIKGLKRLNEQGHFTNDNEMIKIINEYKLDNNPPLGFIQENISAHKDHSIPKKEIYKRYTEWSKENGYKAVSDKTLTKTIRKYFTNGVMEDRTGSVRLWRGLIWQEQEGQESEEWQE
jgi:putative DNA primase/helicase